MRSDPRIWIKIKELENPHPLNRTAFEALKTHIAPLAEAGIEIVAGHEKDWARGVEGFPRDWLSHCHEKFSDCTFSIVGVLIFAKCVREAHSVGPETVALVKTHVDALIEAGVAVGGGEHNVERVFANAAEFHDWADGPPREFPMRNSPAPFSPYPRK